MIDLKTSNGPHLNHFQSNNPDRMSTFQTSLTLFAAFGFAGLSTGLGAVSELPTGTQTGASTAFVAGSAQPWTSTSAGPCMRSIDFESVSSTRTSLVQIRSAMGLNVTQLAQVLRVERPTVYAWLDGHEPNRTNSDRLHEIAEISQLWRAEDSTLGRTSLNRRTSAGETVLDVLSAAVIDREAIVAALDDRSATPERPSATERAKRLGLSKSSQASKNRDDFVPHGSADDLGTSR